MSCADLRCVPEQDRIASGCPEASPAQSTRDVLLFGRALGVGLAREQAQLLRGAAPLQQALERPEDVARQLSMLVGPVVPATLHTLDGSRADELHGMHRVMTVWTIEFADPSAAMHAPVPVTCMPDVMSGHCIEASLVTLLPCMQGLSKALLSTLTAHLEIYIGIGQCVQVRRSCSLVNEDVLYQLKLLQPTAAARWLVSDIVAPLQGLHKPHAGL